METPLEGIASGWDMIRKAARDLVALGDSSDYMAIEATTVYTQIQTQRLSEWVQDLRSEQLDSSPERCRVYMVLVPSHFHKTLLPMAVPLTSAVDQVAQPLRYSTNKAQGDQSSSL